MHFFAWFVVLVFCSCSRRNEEKTSSPILTDAEPSLLSILEKRKLFDASDSHTPDATSSSQLQRWMQTEVTEAVLSKNFLLLESLFQKMAELPSDNYPNWRSIARDGAEAARASEYEAVEAACRSCHAQYGEKYRSRLHRDL